jgi:hypothetical protein
MIMKRLLVLSLALFFGCGEAGDAPAAADQAAVEKVITHFHRALEAAYAGKNVDLAAEIDLAFDPNARYVTYWGQEEPVDTTRARMLAGIGRVKDYTNAVENIESRVYGEGAVVSCIVRQEYEMNGHRIDEFLPTTYVLERRDGAWKIVFAHRSADFQTIQQQIEITRQTE